MKVYVVVVGKLRGPLEPAVREFEERASRYWKLEILEVDAGLKRGGDRSAEAVRTAEGTRITERVPQGGERWALTRTGMGLTSEALTNELHDRTLHGGGPITFLLGGAFGLERTLLDEAQRRISLSRMTLPHDLARLLLMEQLYRAGTLLRNEPYHKGGGL